MADAAGGRGVAVAASRLAARFGFDELGLARIEILAMPGNRPSLRVAVKLGAVCEGVARNGLIAEDMAREAVVHSLIPADLSA